MKPLKIMFSDNTTSNSICNRILYSNGASVYIEYFLPDKDIPDGIHAINAFYNGKLYFADYGQFKDIYPEFRNIKPQKIEQ